MLLLNDFHLWKLWILSCSLLLSTKTQRTIWKSLVVAVYWYFYWIYITLFPTNNQVQQSKTSQELQMLSPLILKVQLHKSPESLFEGILICLCHCVYLCHCLGVGNFMSPNHSDQMSQSWQVLRIALWYCNSTSRWIFPFCLRWNLLFALLN